MNSAATLDNLIAQWKQQGLSKAEIVVKEAEAMIGWPYVWGASGQDCTPDKRRYFMGRSVCPEGDKELIRKRCQVLSGSAGSCSGCKYYPGGAKTRIQDCQGFMKEICKTVGITLSGGGATSMWNTAANWSEKGALKDLPTGKVCLVFKKVGEKMEHVGLHIGAGQIIHCSVEVKRGKTTDSGWTHWGIPKGLDGDVPVPVTKPTLRRGSTGEYVKELQRDLLAIGYAVGPSGADGIFGRNTETAVRAFQTNSGLACDGICGPRTWEAIDAAVGQEPPPAKRYTVTIQHVDAATANEITGKYGGTATEESEDL